MTREHFAKLKWGVGMIAEYKDSNSKLISEVISVDFEAYEIGLEMPVSGDIIFLPCEKCEIIKDFVAKKC